MNIKILLLICCLLGLQFGYAQRVVTGTVTDAQTNEPLIGANVLVSGTASGAVTDVDGKFSIEVPEQADILSVSYTGYTPQDVSIAGLSDIAVALSPGQLLEEVIVTGYATERKVDLTGAVAVVELDPIKNNNSGNPMQALQGRVAGLYIEKSGNPTGENNRILIRGLNTLGNNDPLYIIDGVPTKRPQVFQSLNPSSIESIQILKDASAASIYGSRASNGVIIVTTKDGRSRAGEKLNIEFNTSLGIQTEMPQRVELLNAEDRGKALWQGAVNDSTDPIVHEAIYTYDWNGNYDNPILNKVNIQPFVGGDPLTPVGDTDWQEESYETGYAFTSDLTISGGTENSSLLVNLGYFNNSGILVYTGYERYSARINAKTAFFNGRLRIGANSELATSNETLSANDLGGASVPSLATSLAPTIPVYRTDGEFAGPVGAGYSDRNNPVHMQYINRWDNLNRTFVFGNAFLEIEPIENLVFRTSLGLDYSTTALKNIEIAFQEGFLGRDVNSLNRTTSNQLSLVWTNTLTYALEFGQSRLNLLAGVEAIKNDFEEFGAFRESFANQTEDYFYLDAGTGRSTNFGRASGNRLLSQFGKISYSLADKYLASVTLRRDGSSRFGEENKYGFFPAVTLGWRISNEGFMSGLGAISDLKLRAGAGRVGNQDIGDLARFGLFEPRYGTLFNNGVGFPGQWLNVGTAYDLEGNDTGTLPSGFVSVQGENLALKWETTEELNLGLDFGFINDRLYGSFDVFFRNTYDILIQPPIASAVGEGKVKWVNGATKENKGFELVLGYRNQKGGFSYNLSGNLSRFRDKITELPEEVRTAYPGNVEKTILGHSELSLFGYRTDGLFQSQAEVDAHAMQVGAGPGRIRYVDLNNDGVINALDQDWLGTVLPAFEYGLRVDLGFKNFDLSLFGSGIAGRSGVDPFNSRNNRLDVRSNNGPGVLEAWTPQNTGSNRPMLSLTDANNEARSSDFFIISTSYFKMRNIQLGYTLPSGTLQKARIGHLRFYLMGDNLFWFNSPDYESSDPELTTLNVIPIATTFTFGINVIFN